MKEYGTQKKNMVVVSFILGDSPAFELRRRGIKPKERVQHSKHLEIFKPRIKKYCCQYESIIGISDTVYYADRT
jgi:hypothetical protein